MYGRVTWYSGRSENADKAIGEFKDLVPKIQQLPGYVGCALMVNREAGEGLSIVYYRDRSTLDESRPIVERMRQQIRTEGEQVARVEEYEITTMERAQPGTTGSWVRVNTGVLEPSKLDEASAAVNERAIPILKKQKGWRSFVGGVNRQTGAALTGTTFDTKEQLEASNQALREFLQEVQQRGRLTDSKTQTYEMAVADVAATSGVRV